MQNPDSGGVEKSQQPLVFFDLETTGLDAGGSEQQQPHSFLPLQSSLHESLHDTTALRQLDRDTLLQLRQSCEIIQLAAVSGGHSLNLFILPWCWIQRGAAKVTGFRVHRRRLYRHRQLVLTNSLREVLVSFIAFLQMLGRPLVIGHNIRRFDCPLLVRALDELDLRAEFESVVSGCVDTLPLAREMLKDRSLQSFRQENLVRELLGVNYKAHDALEDVQALQALYSVLQPTPELVCQHRFTLDTMKNKPAATSKVPCQLPGQCPLWENVRQTVKVTEVTGNKDDTGLHDGSKQEGCCFVQQPKLPD